MNLLNEIKLGTLDFWYEIAPNSIGKLIHQYRLSGIIQYALQNSSFYRDFYKDLDLKNLKKIGLESLPSVDKQTVMANYDAIVTDPDLKLTVVTDYMSNCGNKGSRLLDKYYVIETSGTTWKPIIVPYDSEMMDTFELATSRRMRSACYPYAVLVSDAGYSLGSIANRADRRNGRYRLINSVAPVEEVVSELNKLNPKQVQSFPGTLWMLIQEQKEGRLKLHPKIICTTGENLTKELEEELKKTFGCKVYSIYSSTETGHIATSCKYGHLHYYEDHIKLEAVDRNNRSVPDGVESDKVLITNFMNKAMPLIRYEVSDRVIIHREGCPCGCRRPWLEVCGRDGERVLRIGKDPVRYIPFLSIKKSVVDETKLQYMQLLCHDSRYLEIRLRLKDDKLDTVRKAAYEQAYREYFSKQGLNDIFIEVTDRLPIRNGRSGKALPIVYLSKQNANDPGKIDKGKG